MLKANLHCSIPLTMAYNRLKMTCSFAITFLVDHNSISVLNISRNFTNTPGLMQSKSYDKTRWVVEIHNKLMPRAI